MMTTWKVVGGTVTGRYHEQIGRQCEDSSGWFSIPSLTCLAVADGAGSRLRSATGSRLAVDRVLALAREYQAAGTDANATPNTEQWLLRMFLDINEYITSTAAVEGCDADDYATTLCVAAITEEETCIAQIGDSIAVVHLIGSYETVLPPPRPEYANQTNFITDSSAPAHTRLKCYSGEAVDAVFLATDGLRLKILDDIATAKPYAPFFDAVADYAQDAQASQNAVVRFLARVDDQTGDDKSLLAAVRSRHSAIDYPLIGRIFDDTDAKA